VTVSDFIKRYGKVAGPEGIAIFAYLKDNPDATTSEVAEAIGIGKAALVRHTLRLEGLGLIERIVKKTEKGFILPVTLRASDPLQNGKGASDKTLSKMDTLSESEPLPNQHPYQNEEIDSKGLNLSDPLQNGKGANGTEVAPLSAETITQQNEDATASSARGAGGSAKQSYIGRLLQFREKHLGTKLPAHKTEAAAAKWLFEQGWDFDDVTGCHDFLVSQGKKWRGSAVTLNVVMSQIAEWKKGNLSDGTRTQPKTNGKPTRADVVRNRDYSIFDGAGGEDAGADSRPVSRVEKLAGAVRR
jgi:hypothetical protein